MHEFIGVHFQFSDELIPYRYSLCLSASQPIVGLYSQPFNGLLASSFEVSRSHTTTRHIR